MIGKRQTYPLPRWSPGQALKGFPSGGYGSQLSGAVKQQEVASIIGLRRVTKHRHLCSIRRNPQIAHPAFAFEQHLSYWILQSPLVVAAVNDGEFVPVWSPVGIDHILQQLASRTAAQGRSSQRASPFIVGKIFRLRQDCHLTLP